MSEYNQERLTQDVVDAFARTPDPRLREIMTALVKHVHAFAREVDLKPEEWLAGLQFLTAHRPDLDREAAGVHPAVRHARPVDDGRLAGAGARQRQGASGATPATEATVEGPFYWPGAPDLPLGSDIGEGVPGRADALHGPRHRHATASRSPARCSTSGRATAKASTTCSSSAEPTMKARGRFRTDAEGRYWFWSIQPTFYPVPDDGPVGEMLRAMGRSI